MIYRLIEYNGMTLRKHKLPIKHVVIYLGESAYKVKLQLKVENFYFAFKKIELRLLNTKRLLSSQIPEEVLLAVLSNYPKEKAESILRLIRNKLLILCKNETERSKYFSQLMVLLGLRRDLNLITSKILGEMPVTFDFSQHILVKQGIEKGIGQGIDKGIEIGAKNKEQEDNYRFVKNLI